VRIAFEKGDNIKVAAAQKDWKSCANTTPKVMWSSLTPEKSSEIGNRFGAL
jgi:hypothetical protein